MVHPGSRGWTGSQEETASPGLPAPKESLPETPSRAIAEQVGTPVWPGSRERGVLRVPPALAVQESTETRGVRERRAFQDRLDHLVSKVSQVKVSAHLDLRVHLDHEEIVASLEFKVTEACQESRECQVFLEGRVKRDTLELDPKVP